MSLGPGKFFSVARAVRFADFRRTVDAPECQMLLTQRRVILVSPTLISSVHFDLHCRLALCELNVCLLVAVAILQKRDMPSRCSAVFQSVRLV